MKLDMISEMIMMMTAPVTYGTSIRLKLMPLSNIEMISLREESFEVNQMTLMKVNNGMKRLMK